jgi:hypothetical protein
MAIRILHDSIGLIACNASPEEYQSSGGDIIAAHGLMRLSRPSVIMEQLDMRRRPLRRQADDIDGWSGYAIQTLLLDALIQ